MSAIIWKRAKIKLLTKFRDLQTSFVEVNQIGGVTTTQTNCVIFFTIAMHRIEIIRTIRPRKLRSESREEKEPGITHDDGIVSINNDWNENHAITNSTQTRYKPSIDFSSTASRVLS